MKVGKFSHSLRKHIFKYEIINVSQACHELYYIDRENLGLLDTSNGDKVVEDPIAESFYKVVTLQLHKKLYSKLL